MARGAGAVRIIGGAWRGRRLHFPAAAGLRPTADRRRETLFNWLGGALDGNVCLDLFAGSGALGFEAASRGARHVDLVENQRAAARALADNRERLAADTVTVHATDARRFLAAAPAAPFDIVFLDPPFGRPELADAALVRLTAGWLSPAARVYLETPARAPAPDVPVGWQLYRELTGGDAHARLYLVE